MKKVMRNPPSLRTYLILVIVVATVPLGALTSWLMYEEIMASRQQMTTGLQRTATSLALLVDREQLSSIDALTILANSDTLKEKSLHRFHGLLSRLPKIRPYWSRVYLVDQQGQILLSNDQPYGTPIRQRVEPRDLQQVLSRKVPHVTGVNRHPQSSGWLTRIDVPVLLDDRVRYVLSADIDVSAWQRLVASVTPPETGFVTIFDADARIVARSMNADKTVGRQLPPAGRQQMANKVTGFHKVPMLEGGATYVAWHRLSSSGWGVGVGVNAAAIDRQSIQAISASVTTGLLSLLAGLALAGVVVRRVNQPLQALSTGGASSVKADISVKEIAQLRDAMATAQTQQEEAWEQLEAQADQFEALFNESPIGLSMAQDVDCRVVIRNAAKVAMFSIQPDTEPTFKLYENGAELPLDRHPLARAAKGETLTNLELQVRHDDGRHLTLLVHAVPLWDAKGQPRGGIATFVDITERMHAQEKLKQAQHRLEGSQRLVDLAQEAGDVGFFDYVFATDTVSVTSGLARLLGIDGAHTSMAWAAWVGRVHSEDVPEMESVLRHAWAHRLESVALKFRVRSDDLRERYLSSRMALLYEDSGKPMRMIGVMVDVTAQQLIEEERARLILQEQKARLEAENANQAKDEFLAMLGHELRNPLSAISAAIEVLNRLKDDEEQSARARMIIHRQTRHLARLMDDLLDVARVIAGKIRLSKQPMNLGESVARLITTMKVSGQLQEHDLDLEVADVWVHADAVRLEQIVTNLVTNAVKYSPSKQPIKVVVSRQEQTARLQVFDQGMGIPDNLLPRIFDLFVQGERALDRRQGGLGIGLTLVKSLVELHGGRVFVNTGASGSTFTVELPVVPSGHPDAAAPSVAATGSRQVVVVEDNPDGRETMRDMLELKGHQVWTEGDGHAGLSRIVSISPHVALVDIGLPGLSGYEVALMARERGFKGWLVALSGYGQPKDVHRALECGFDAHMVKPLDAAEFETYLRNTRPIQETALS